VGILTSPPFYTIPGINPATPLSTQTEQIDQLNTLLLQNIDANFARVHQVITTRILPDIKRFALASEPTRRTAEFWHHFFASAAGTHVDEGEVTMTTMTTLSSAHEDRTESVAGSSFMSAFEPGVSSTPLPTRRDPSWDASDVESPFAKVDRDLGVSLHASNDSSLSTPSVVTGYGQMYDYDASTGTVETDIPDMPRYLSSARNASAASASDSQSHSHAEPPEFKSYAHESLFRRSDSVRSLEPSRASSTTLQRSTAALHESTRSAADDSDGSGSDTGATPRAPVPQRVTPGRPRPSHHLIDLTTTPLNIAKFSRTFDPNDKSKSRSKPAAAASAPMRDLLEDSDDMGSFSPVMQFTKPYAKPALALPPRAHAIFQETRRAPADEDRAQTQRLGSLIADMTAALSPSPAKMTMPDELRRYSIMPSDGRRLFDTTEDSPNVNVFAPRGTANANANANVFAPRHDSPFNPDTYAPGAPRRSMANTSFGSDMQTAAGSPGRAMSDDGEDMDSFDDTVQLREEAAAGFVFEDDDEDSYMSDDMSYRRAGGGEGGFTDTHVHAHRGDQPDSEVFGRPSGGRGQFALHQQDEMCTYHGGALEDAIQPRTPLGGAEADISSLGLGRR
jgi:DASH complex subunit ASK1